MIIRRTVPLLAVLSLCYSVLADVAPEVTTVEEGYNFVAKVPCLGCPFLFQDTSKGEQAPWTERQDQNALLLNISLPYDSAFLTINNKALYSGSRNLPQIYATQVVQDLSTDQLAALLVTNQLEAGHETGPGGGFFGLSYRSSLRRLKTSQDVKALLFQFDVLELWSDLPEQEMRFPLDDPAQKLLEVVLVEKQLLSALEPVPTYEILSAALVPRSLHPFSSSSSGDGTVQTMHFLEWDMHGRKGTTAHFLSRTATSFVEYIASGFWALFVFVMLVVALFVIICLICIFGWGFWEDEYERSQYGKRSRRRSGRGDVEMAKGRFRSAEELGLVGKGRVIGMGKSD